MFAARIIDKDKGKFQLSARDSVVEDWDPMMSSAKFAKKEEARAAVGNLRNKILKYSGSVILQEGDLA